MAYVRPGPRPVRPSDVGATVLAVAVLLLVMGSIVLATLYLAGYLSSEPASVSQQPAVVSPDARPTPYWPFRPEWLTPHPKSP